MQKQQVFKVKGMQRDASMANANGEFAYEILNMRLMPAEDLSGFSLTNEKGTTAVITDIAGQVIGQCPTNDSLVVFTTDIVTNEDGTQSKTDYIYEIYQTVNGWTYDTLYSGNLNFDVNKPIEALFNYETEDIQKVYWIDGINQLRCINLVASDSEKANWNDQSFDSVKEINSLPSVEIERGAGGSFTAGVIQYYVTYFNKNLSESPIVYTSPLLYIAHSNRGANVNDQVSTAFKLTFTDLDTANWEYMRIYATHRTSIDATPEASIVIELNMDNSVIEFTDYGGNRISLAPTDLYFTGGKFIKAGTMTVKDQVMFLGNLNIDTPETVSVIEIQNLFDSIRDNENHPFSTTTRKAKENKLEEYDDTYYYYKNQLNNTEPITHYKYGEKYRFGISVLDKYGNWSNPIWIKDAFIEVPPEQVDGDTLELPCPSLNLAYKLEIEGQTQTLWAFLQAKGVQSIKPIVVFPSADERKVIAQGVVCPTVYNLKDRKENGPYAQASWFMRPNIPGDIIKLGENDDLISLIRSNTKLDLKDKSDLLNSSTHFRKGFDNSITITDNNDVTNFKQTLAGILLDDIPISEFLPAKMDNDKSSRVSYSSRPVSIDGDTLEEEFISYVKESSAGDGPTSWSTSEIAKYIINTGCWAEFRHNFPLRTKGWDISNNNNVNPLPVEGLSGEFWDYRGEANADSSGVNIPYSSDRIWINNEKVDGSTHVRVITYLWSNVGAMARCAELDVSRFSKTIPFNCFTKDDVDNNAWNKISLTNFNTDTSAYYVDSSIVTMNSPEIEFESGSIVKDFINYDFRIVGMIPLTASISDISVITKNAPLTSQEILNAGFQTGIKKIIASTKNIGHTAFRGLISGSVYGGNTNTPQAYRIAPNYTSTTEGNWYYEYEAANVLVHPWQSTGNISSFTPNSNYKTTNSVLQRKIISNLRYSASSYFFSKSTTIDNNSITDSDSKAGIIPRWVPENGSVWKIWNGKDGIIKLNLDNDIMPDLTYKGDVDSIAMMSGGQASDNPLRFYPFFAGKKLRPSSQIIPDDAAYTSPIGIYDYYKQGIGASIKYKSSPHAVIGFNLKDDKQIILPCYGTLNQIKTSGSEYFLYENNKILATPIQQVINTTADVSFGLPGLDSYTYSKRTPTYGWLWLGELYNNQDPTFGGTSEFALQNNQWENAGINGVPDIVFENLNGSWTEPWSDGGTTEEYTFEAECTTIYDGSNLIIEASHPENIYRIYIPDDSDHASFYNFFNVLQASLEDDYLVTIVNTRGNDIFKGTCRVNLERPGGDSEIVMVRLSSLQDETMAGLSTITINNIPNFAVPGEGFFGCKWTQGDTYYQRFDTLKTYAYSDSDENSIVDITSFMVETRINIDGRTDRNRGQESNLQMSPTNFNLMNDVYSQRDNFFTYRILDEDLQARTNFPNQITWSLTKTAGASIDSWMNITLASVLDLDGTKGKISALKNFNNNIIAFQEKGLSHIMFNSRAQIATSEAVPIQIANTGKVDGQQYFTTDVGCQDKWNIVTTPNGLYFVDYFNKSIYRFNGQLEDISTPNGFRSWCYEHLNSSANILGYYDVKNKEVMYYIGDTGFMLDNSTHPGWLGFSELTGVFSSFYTYPKAWFANVQDRGLWLLSEASTDDIDYTNVYTHQTGAYNQLLNVSESFYGLTVLPRQDSNIVKTFNNVEFRADSFDGNGYNESILPFDTISAETEYQDRTPAPLTYDKYKPSNLKKKLRTWRANIPRVNNGYHRFVNQWAKIGLWKMDPSTEKTILHDLSVWYSE